jgi:transposase
MGKSLFQRTIPKATRQDILRCYAQGLSTHEVAAQLQISDAWARRVKQEYQEPGKTQNATTRQRVPQWLPLVPQIRQVLAEQPDLTLTELKAQLGTHLHPGTLCRILQKLKLTLKKKS